MYSTPPLTAGVALVGWPSGLRASPDLVIDTGAMTVEESLQVLEEYVENVFRLEDG